MPNRCGSPTIRNAGFGPFAVDADRLAAYARKAHTLRTDFDWDDDKDDACRQTFGFGFEDAIMIFFDDVVLFPDERDYGGESRMLAVGEWQGDFYTVVYTDRGDTRHIITAWPSELEERRLWERSR